MFPKGMTDTQGFSVSGATVGSCLGRGQVKVGMFICSALGITQKEKRKPRTIPAKL